MNQKIFYLLIFFIFIFNPICSADVQFGDKGGEVEEIQKLLTEKNYFSGIIDGDFGEETEKAVKNFQRDNGLEIDGICGEETFKMLRNSIEVQSQRLGRNPEETSNNLTQPKEPLKFGSQGYEVRQLQEMLIGLGYLTGTADGDFGEATEKALKDFQTAANLEVTGIFDDATFNMMNNPITFETGKIPEDAGVAEVGDIIKPGMHGAGVKYIQQKLIERGFLDGDADGWCGEATVAAIRDFQYSMNLPADGICGILTYAALENAEYINDDSSEWEKSVAEFPKFKQTIYVEATAYSRFDSTAGNRTALGTSVKRGIIAVDPDVIPLGTRVYIPGYGEAVAEDTGGDIKGNRIDIAFDTYEEAQDFGRQSLQIYIIED